MTPKSQCIHRGRPTTGEWLRVIKFEKTTALAAMPVGAHERAPSPIAFPHRAADVSRNVTRGAATGWTDRGGCRPLNRALCRPGGAELPTLEPRDQGIQRAVEHLGHVSGWNGMAEQSLGVA
jgi:hypothetical protein